MNFYNPYYYSLPNNVITPKVGLLGRLFGKTGVSIGNFLNNTQRVLNIANQTIPIVKQVKPMISNAKTMFKVMNEFKKTDKNTKTNYIKDNINDNLSNNINNNINDNTLTDTKVNDGPVFFI